jgi:RimJ/RimL family protein N-acetyltransferase
LVVYRIDRLARDLVLQETLLAEVHRLGGELFSTSNAEASCLTDDPDGPSRKLIRQVLGAVAEYERAMIALRLRAGRRRKRENGDYAYGAPPFGYRSNGGVLEPVPEEQRALARMRELRTAGESFEAIARVSTREGVQTKRGGMWSGKVVRDALWASAHHFVSLATAIGAADGRTRSPFFRVHDASTSPDKSWSGLEGMSDGPAPRRRAAIGQSVTVNLLRGEGFELRPLRTEDAAAHNAAEDLELTGSNFLGPAPIENVIPAIESRQDSRSTDGPVRNFGIWGTNGVLIGNVELRKVEARRVEVSYLVFPDFRRSGIATRATQLALAYAASDLGARIATIKMLATNDASVGVARSLGAHQVGQEKNDAGWTMLVFELEL